MKRVELRYIKDINSHLQFVRLIKEFTGMGLKEAKEFCDNCRSYPNTPFVLMVNNDIEFKSKIEDSMGDSILVSNKEHQRNIKLIKLGIGDYQDMIDILSDQISTDLLINTISNYKNYIKDLILDMEIGEDKLIEIINNRVK